MTDDGFSKAQSDNLPKVDIFMVSTYIRSAESFSLEEIRGVKTEKSGRYSYGDAAVGWVQVKRDKNLCSVKGKITPEHSVKKKQYSVTCNIDEASEKVLEVQCHDCAASLGGCKHAVAFLMWLHRRSEEPAPTEITCYWAKSKLSKVGTTIKFITLKEFGAKEELSSDEESSFFLTEVIDKGIQNKSEGQLFKHYKPTTAQDLGLYQLLLKFVSLQKIDCADFLEFCSKFMKDELCSEAADLTRDQAKSALWYELRYGRITASKIYEAAHCKKSDGVFVKQILGVSKLPETSAMARGKKLEAQVIRCIEKKFQVKLNSIGLQLDPKYPIFGASPDAICEEYVVEVKCPQSQKTFNNYLTKDKIITAKYKAQVQLQMFLLKRKKCLFCVADPEFENNSNFSLAWVEYV